MRIMGLDYGSKTVGVAMSDPLGITALPKHMNNDLGERAQKALAFGEMVKRRTGLEVVMWDERLTTVEAERTLIENNVRRENRKQYIDKIAAVFILQGYLDSIG